MLVSIAYCHCSLPLRLLLRLLLSLLLLTDDGGVMVFKLMPLGVDLAMAMTMDVAMTMGVGMAIKHGDHSVA